LGIIFSTTKNQKTYKSKDVRRRRRRTWWI